MIVKERDLREHPEQDRFAVAGAKAEAQLAFYLRRAFVDDPAVLVFNDLRFKDGRRYFKYCDTCASGETLYCEFVTE